MITSVSLLLLFIVLFASQDESYLILGGPYRTMQMCSPHTARLPVIISCTDPFERKLKLTAQFLSHLVTFLLQLVYLDILHPRCHSSTATIYTLPSVYLNDLHSVICLAQQLTSRHLSI